VSPWLDYSNSDASWHCATRVFDMTDCVQHHALHPCLADFGVMMGSQIQGAGYKN